MRRAWPTGPGARRWARRVAAIALSILALVACGRKGAPVAPERRVPAPVSELQAAVEGPAVVLEWTNPGRSADGSRMRDLTTVRVFRREEQGSGEPKPAVLSWGKIVGYDEIMAIQLAVPAPARVTAGKVAWTDSRGLVFGHRYVYVLTALDSTGRQSIPSERLVVTFHPAPRPPENLRARPGEREVRLAWSPPAQLVDGSPLLRPVAYRLLRAGSPGAPFQPISPLPLTATEFTDRELDNERTYLYMVQAVRTELRESVRSEPSATVEATPVDLTPPSAPQNLVAVPSETAVRLAWDPSPERDVAGYLVYRAISQSAEYVRLTPAAVSGTLYTDRTVERGKVYRYAVTAVDRARAPNESARSTPTTVTIP